MSDVIVQQAVDLLLTCLGQAVSGQPDIPQHVCLRVGLEVAHDADLVTDLCCEGLAYVSLGDMWVSASSFPEQDVVRQADSACGIISWGFELRAGIVRCAPTGTGPTMPTCEEWTAAARQNMYDAKSLRTAACCFRSGLGDLDQYVGMSVVVGRQVQGPVQGGCTERYVTIQVQMPNCDC